MISPRGFSDLFTFTRAAAANFLDEQGLVQSAGIDVPRFEYDSAGNFIGLLLEDADSMTMTNIDWFNPLEGTFFVEFSRPGTGGELFPVVCQMDDGSNANRYIIFMSTTSVFPRVLVGSINEAAFTFGGVVADQFHKVAFAYKVNDVAASMDGAVVQEDTLAVMPTGITTLRLGNDTGGNALEGHIKEFRYYPRRLTNEELVTLTTTV